MRRILAFGIAWLCAAIVAVVVAWQGVGLIGNQVTSYRPATLNSSEVAAALRADASTTVPGAASTSTTLPPAAAAPGSTPAAPDSSSPTATTATSATATPGGGGGNTGTGTTAGTAAPGTTAAASPVTKTYHVSGGTVELRFAPEGTTLAYARPNAGYEITRNEPSDNNGYRVEFEGPAGKSRVEGWWDNGPQWRIEDDAAGGGSGGPG